ncbi:MAG: glycosyl hydrolase 108 family protein [bacterium]|nr:glycosyl hydrolase 108 family protein [bacterium]
MADFLPIYNSTLKKEGGYQADPSDSANYCYSYIKGKRTRGALIGTNKGISATALQVYLKRCPTVAEIKAITPELAYKIFKANYWDKIQGSLIKDQSVAQMIFQMRIGSGNLVHCRQAINLLCLQVFKKKLIYESGMNMQVPANWQYEFIPSSINVINSLPAEKLFNTLKTAHSAYYDKIIKNDPKLEKFETGWKNRLASIEYTPAEKIGGIGGFFLP